MICPTIIYVNVICNNIPVKGGHQHQQSADVGGVNFSLKSQLWSHLQMIVVWRLHRNKGYNYSSVNSGFAHST